jgi:hypothetical protein
MMKMGESIFPNPAYNICKNFLSGNSLCLPTILKLKKANLRQGRDLLLPCLPSGDVKVEGFQAQMDNSRLKK